MKKIGTFNFFLALIILIINFWFKEWAHNTRILQGTLLDLLMLLLLFSFTVWSIASFREYRKFLYLIAAIFLGIAFLAKLTIFI